MRGRGAREAGCRKSAGVSRTVTLTPAPGRKSGLGLRRLFRRCYRRQRSRRNGAVPRASLVALTSCPSWRQYSVEIESEMKFGTAVSGSRTIFIIV
jgi:hypothetical protein